MAHRRDAKSAENRIFITYERDYVGFPRVAGTGITMDKSSDHLERRCPRLGGPVTFRYCRDSGEEALPCWKVFDCWWEYFDIVTYLKENLSDDRFAALRNAESTPKITSIIDQIHQAKKRARREER
ncbi:MAG: hypothetical protein V3S89_06125 [Desulfobacterales bacterium]